MTLCEKMKEELIETIKNKSVLEIAFLVKQTSEYENNTMDEIVKALESEVEKQ